MHTIEDISKLTNQQLAQAMKEIDINVPITSSTRKICENRYKSYLYAKYHQNDSEDSSTETAVVAKDIQNKDIENDTDTKENEKDNNANDSIVVKTPVQNGLASGHSEIPHKEDHSKTLNGEKSDLKNRTYYGVWVPFSPTRKKENDEPLVFGSQVDALKVMKNFRGSRFKSFPSKDEAESFSLSKPNHLTVDKICALVASTLLQDLPVKTIIKAPTFHELMKFRKSIEENQLQVIQSCLTSNPKYLISSGDMPVMLQEGSRLNAVHICIKYNKLEVLDYVLRTLQSDKFLQLMYPDADSKSIDFRRTHLLDLYLNTPEKILCDSPLHIACKFGFLDIIRYLLDYEQLNVKALNKDGKSCKQVICQRVNMRGEANLLLKNKVRLLLEEKAYIPLFDLEIQCKVGKPVISFSPKALKSTNKKIKAFAGPMSIEKAPNIYERWSKSPKTKKYGQMVLTDFDKGMERIGRIISYEEKVPYNEYWPFLECYTNLHTKPGLVKLENYLKTKHDRKSSVKTKAKRRLSLSAPKSVILKNNINIDDSEIKRKLVFDDSEETSNIIQQNKVLANSNNNASTILSKETMKLNNQGIVKECYCICGELLERCEECGAVNINLKKSSVSFTKKRSPSKSDIESSFDKDVEVVRNKLEQFQITSTEQIVVSNGYDSPLEDFTDGNNDGIFIYGDYPSKQDVDVLRAVGDSIIEPLQFPHIHKWKKYIDTFPNKEIRSWPTPGSPRYKKRIEERNLLWTA